MVHRKVGFMLGKLSGLSFTSKTKPVARNEQPVRTTPLRLGFNRQTDRLPKGMRLAHNRTSQLLSRLRS